MPLAGDLPLNLAGSRETKGRRTGTTGDEVVGPFLAAASVDHNRVSPPCGLGDRFIGAGTPLGLDQPARTSRRFKNARYDLSRRC